MPRFQANFHLYAENLNRAIAFYTEYFQFKLLSHVDNENNEPWAALKVENAILWLGQNGANSGLIILIDKEIEKFVTRLVENNVEFFIPEEFDRQIQENQIVLNTDWGKHAWFFDSERNAVMLFQPFEQ
jgi:catechol 2,3-dioxygenase-like lactoylglutathione lyase family enzyme